MNDYSEKQIEELLERMPAIMALLRRRAGENDPDAKAIFAQLDSWCWHDPICAAGDPCEGGLPRWRPAAVLR